MKERTWLYWILLLICIATVVSGLVQLFAPAFILGLVGGEATATSKHFFGIVGMFMFLFGGMLFQALWGPKHQPVAVFWAGLQKFGASVAVALGILRGIFGPLAWLVAGFDLLSGVLVMMYWLTVRRS